MRDCPSFRSERSRTASPNSQRIRERTPDRRGPAHSSRHQRGRAAAPWCGLDGAHVGRAPARPFRPASRSPWTPLPDQRMGVSFDTVLRKSLRENPAMATEFKRYRTEYCVPDDLLRGIDRIAAGTEGNVQKLRERRITYVLKTGANWAGPIKDFKVVIDKGLPERLVSFCLDNVKKISPTAFEIREGLHAGTRSQDPADRKGRLNGRAAFMAIGPGWRYPRRRAARRAGGAPETCASSRYCPGSRRSPPLRAPTCTDSRRD